jgi:hypothetical protein
MDMAADMPLEPDIGIETAVASRSGDLNSERHCFSEDFVLESMAADNKPR